MLAKGYKEEYAQRVFRQLEGFGSYGFPESHAVSFALLVYVSSWVKCYYPDVFAAALLNSMPMGFYQPAQIVIDAQKHGVEIRAIDINHSQWDNTLEKAAGSNFCALRLGFRQVKGLKQEELQTLVDNRSEQGYTSISQLRQVGIQEATLEKLADADAFRSLQQDRREALWNVSAKDKITALFPAMQTQEAEKDNIVLPTMALSEHVLQDYAATSLSIKAHPVQFVREELNQFNVTPNAQLAGAKDGDLIRVAGLVLVRQRPGTASGICFITVEDETGIANLVVFQKLFNEYRKEIVQSKLLMVEGRLQREGEVLHVVVQRCFNFSGLLKNLSATSKKLASKVLHADETTSPFLPEGVFYGGRNFR
jgi:error-prone DNA polymerase